MPKRRRRNKVKRYLAVYKRQIKRTSRQKVLSWLKRNFKSHPFILGILFFVWLNSLLTTKFFEKGNIIEIIKLHFFIFIAWVILVVASNLLRDKNKVKWYLRKRFVFTNLLFLFPLGLILLWSGAQFKRVTKIVLTTIFVSIFISSQVYYYIKYEKLSAQNPIERIAQLITQPKKKIHLKSLGKDALRNLQFATIPKKAKVKLAVSDIAAKSSLATVSIKTKDKNGEELGLGSGFIISSDGIIVTNFHVLESAYEAVVKIADKEFKEVFLIKGDPSLDMALLKIDSKDLPSLPVGNSDDLVNGQFVVVLGNPWGFERSVSSGIISAIRSYGAIKIIQMTAPVSPGSSGGPVINEYGEAIGITTLASFFLAQNLNFAIPINYLKKIISEK